MPQEVRDIDELEAMLAGLNEDELSQLDDLDTPTTTSSTVVDEDISDAELVDDPVVTAGPVRRKRRLKPLESTPEVKPVATATSEEDDLAALADLDAGYTDEQVVMLNEAASLSKSEQELADKVVDLLVSLQVEFADLSDEEFQVKIAPVVGRIDVNSTIEEIELHLRNALTPEPEPMKMVEKLAEVTKPIVERIAAEEASVDLGDAELDALLAAAPADPTPVATPAPLKPVAVTPTRKSGALNTFIDADKLQEDLKFTENSISLAMTRQAALFAHYARLSADATYQSDRAKQQVELLEAQLNQRFRDSLVAAGTKFTEKSIDAMVISDSSYQAAQERAHEARAIAKMVESATESFRHRKDMLIQVGADLRMEKQGEMRMKEHPGQRAVGAM